MSASASTDPEFGLPGLPRRRSTAESAAQALRSHIAHGQLPPGAKLSEEVIASAFGISRNTVREAFRLLSHERLVEHTLNRGVFVRIVTPEDIRAMYVTRRLVEPLGVRAAARSATAQERLRDAVTAGTAAADREDWDSVGTADIDFHRQLMAACDSRHLSTMFEQLLAELRLAFLSMPDRRSLHEPFLDRNRRLADLLQAQQDKAAFAELADYLDTAEEQLLHALQQAGT